MAPKLLLAISIAQVVLALVVLANLILVLTTPYPGQFWVGIALFILALLSLYTSYRIHWSRR